MDKKALLLLWAIFGIISVVMLAIFKEEGLYILLLYLLLLLGSRVEEKGRRIQELKDLIYYLDDKLDIFSKMSENEGKPYFELRWLLKERYKAERLT